MNEVKSNSPIKRREFIKGATAATAVGVGISAVPGGVKAALTNRPVHYAMVIDARKCTGCQACSVACKTEFEVPLGAQRSWVEYVEKGTFPNVSRSFLPRLCNQCSEPQCVSVCPTGATYKRKEDGIIAIDQDKCIGCKYCLQACPYDARFINPKTGTADKCDFCLHRITKGLEPSCVNTCQARARIFGDLNDPNSEVAKLVATQPVTVLRQEMGTKPNVFYIGADHADESDTRVPGQYIRVDTHRPATERR